MSCDGELPALYEDCTRRARREHRCCECRRPITVGQTYHEHRGIWGGKWSTYRNCLRCERVRNKLARESDCCIVFGGVREELRERSSWRRQT